jgi:hypothetical protein
VRDRQQERVIQVHVPERSSETAAEPAPVSPVDWRSLFVEGVPTITSQDAFRAVLLYPEDEAEIGELAAQPFVADYLQDLAEQDREIGTLLTKAERILIENGDAAIATCIPFDRPRDYTVRVRVPAFAQKQAQQLWTVCAELQRWDWLKRIRFVPMTPWQHDPSSQSSFDLAYLWVPAAKGDDRLHLLTMAKELRLILRSGGCAFVVGSTALSGIWGTAGLRTSWQEPVDQLPTFRMHRTILPKARLNPGLTLYLVTKV